MFLLLLIIYSMCLRNIQTIREKLLAGSLRSAFTSSTFLLVNILSLLAIFLLTDNFQVPNSERTSSRQRLIQLPKLTGYGSSF